LKDDVHNFKGISYDPKLHLIFLICKVNIDKNKNPIIEKYGFSMIPIFQKSSNFIN